MGHEFAWAMNRAGNIAKEPRFIEVPVMGEMVAFTASNRTHLDVLLA